MIYGLVGPTATGKTAVALECARALGAEIVCADSMTIYRGMDIGTAKPTAAERASVPHHMLDIAEPMEPFTVARFQKLAILPPKAIVTGGSGLYFRAVVDELEFPPTHPDIRARLEMQDPAELAIRLKQLDPEASEFIDPANTRRIIRALEVIHLTGKPFSSFRAAWDRYADIPVAGLMLDPVTLDERIRARLRTMLDNGLLVEVAQLLEQGYEKAITASRAIAYADAILLLRGTITEGEFVEQAARATRKLARRQMSWFKRDPRVTWFDATDLVRATGEIRAYYLEQGA